MCTHLLVAVQLSHTVQISTDNYPRSQVRPSGNRLRCLSHSYVFMRVLFGELSSSLLVLARSSNILDVMVSLSFRSLIFGLLAVLFLDKYETHGKVFTRCGAAVELQRAGISRSWISNWVCLMESVSSLDTQRVTGPHRASSYSFGILQVPSSEWCTRGRRGGTCSIRCEDLTNDDIQDDIRCAKKIFDSRGFGAWDGWVRSCKNKPLPNVSMCRRR